MLRSSSTDLLQAVVCAAADLKNKRLLLRISGAVVCQHTEQPFEVASGADCIPDSRARRVIARTTRGVCDEHEAVVRIGSIGRRLRLVLRNVVSNELTNSRTWVVCEEVVRNNDPVERSGVGEFPCRFVRKPGSTGE